MGRQSKGGKEDGSERRKMKEEEEWGEAKCGSEEEENKEWAKSLYNSWLQFVYFLNNSTKSPDRVGDNQRAPRSSGASSSSSSTITSSSSSSSAARPAAEEAAAAAAAAAARDLTDTAELVSIKLRGFDKDASGGRRSEREERGRRWITKGAAHKHSASCTAKANTSQVYLEDTRQRSISANLWGNELCVNMAAESLAELRDWLFLLLLCLTLLAEVLELAAAAIAMETGEGDEGIVCPSVCRCDEGFVYCNDRGLSIIPPLPLMAAILYLQSNRLSNAGLPPSLERSTSIRVIYLYANQLDEFPIHLPPSLRELHLQDNNIRTLPRSALAKLPLLERLHLDDNSISTVSIQERAFSGTPRLRLLFLSRNHLSSIPAGLPASLEELRLDDNRISTIPTHAFLPWAFVPATLSPGWEPAGQHTHCR
ncbi:hypothetical protein L3Q82_020507 [Scortum barcoo]|uniref:Uncharacterized protein n=1 Tax=Scortum barcoo TaxID=214431 RepID=A0ACB8V819_9TELE|nr:hypothetical protein L3Q82_020507 [Scortum barcoo]